MDLRMIKYVSLPYNKKLNLLREHSVSCDWPDLDQENWRLHCSQKFNGHSVRVWQDETSALWLEAARQIAMARRLSGRPAPGGIRNIRKLKRRKRKAKRQARKEDQRGG